MILAVTGHRKIGGGYGDNPIARAVVARMGAELDRLKPTRVISGMALGVDQWFAWLAVRRGYPLSAVVPYASQDYGWRTEQVDKYRQLLCKASEVVTLSEPPASKQDAARKLQARNEWMVDHCDILLAVWDGSNSGTGNCVRYAQKVGREIVRIDPGELK